jgi:adenine-specific DNA-methyltransferase
LTNNLIIHGDSRATIPTIKTPIDCVITDPPYGMDFASNFAKGQGKDFTKKIEGDLTLPEAIKLFHCIMGPIIEKMADECEIYIFTAWHVLDHWMPACMDLAFCQPNGELTNWWMINDKGKRVPGYPENKFDTGIRIKQMLIWEKGYPGLGDLKANWGCGHEVILYLKKGRREVPERRSAILHYDKLPTGKNIHPTEKPVPLLRKLIEMSTSPGDFVVDPFSGSGSTSAAAQELGRNSLAFEIDEQYIERSRSRLEMKSIFSMQGDG